MTSVYKISPQDFLSTGMTWTCVISYVLNLCNQLCLSIRVGVVHVKQFNIEHSMQTFLSNSFVLAMLDVVLKQINSGWTSSYHIWSRLWWIRETTAALLIVSKKRQIGDRLRLLLQVYFQGMVSIKCLGGRFRLPQRWGRGNTNHNSVMHSDCCETISGISLDWW